MSCPTEFGKKLRELRRERGLSMEELASAIGVSKQSVSNWEKGLNKPQPEHLERLAEFFGQPFEMLGKVYYRIESPETDALRKRVLWILLEIGKELLYILRKGGEIDEEGVSSAICPPDDCDSFPAGDKSYKDSL